MTLSAIITICWECIYELTLFKGDLGMPKQNPVPKGFMHFQHVYRLWWYLIGPPTTSPTCLHLWYHWDSKDNSNGCISCMPSFTNHLLVNHCPQAVSSPAYACPFLLRLLVGYCIIIHHLLLSLHIIVRPSTLSLPATFAANRQPLPLGGLDTNCHPPFASPIVGWLLLCCVPLAFVIALHCVIVNALIAEHFYIQLSTTALRWSPHQPPPAFAAPVVA